MIHTICLILKMPLGIVGVTDPLAKRREHPAQTKIAKIAHAQHALISSIVGRNHEESLNSCPDELRRRSYLGLPFLLRMVARTRSGSSSREATISAATSTKGMSESAKATSS